MKHTADLMNKFLNLINIYNSSTNEKHSSMNKTQQNQNISNLLYVS